MGIVEAILDHILTIIQGIIILLLILITIDSIVDIIKYLKKLNNNIQGTEMNTKNIVGAFVINHDQFASILNHHLQREYTDKQFEFRHDILENVVYKYRYLFFDEQLFTEVNSFVKKMNIKTKKYNLKHLKD